MFKIKKFFKETSSSEWLFITIILSLAFAWTLELFFDMKPCSLCLLQRFGMYVAAILLLLKITLCDYNNTLNNVFAKRGLLLVSLLGLVGSLIAGLRQSYIQSLPEDEIPSCGADLETLLNIVSPFEAVKKVFEGSGECAEKALTVMGLSLANWATILFIGLIIVNLYAIIKAKK